VETPLTDFKDGDFADPLAEFGDGGDLEDPLTVFGEVDLDEPVGFGFGGDRENPVGPSANPNSVREWIMGRKGAPEGLDSTETELWCSNHSVIDR